ncbi:AAWKG family protein, partial [Streptomyces sp. NPDC047042]|uniref:AAWKG family protein n=1 Tax=Streptomyces sp. NPDC047042 TaxID=3154807 RepID=UPI0033FC38B9
MPLDPSKVTNELTAANDVWAEAIGFFTGYPMPARDILFDTLVGNEGIPLMKVEISTMNSVDYVDTEDYSWVAENAGYKINNTDFVIPFYSASGGEGSEVTYHKARITLLGDHTEKDGELTGGVIEGGTFSSHIDGHLGMDGKPTWDTTPLNQYSYGSGRALEALLWRPEGTHAFKWGGRVVDNANSVTLANFDVVAGAFDRVAKFFVDQQKKVEEWQGRLGTEENDAWRGQAAGVFWDLVDKLNKQYSDYAEDMSPNGSYYSKQGNEIRDAKTALEKAAGDLQREWASWEWEDGNPLVHLHNILAAIVDYTWYNNITQITYDVEVLGDSVYTTYEAEKNFSNQAKLYPGHNLPSEWGSLDFGPLKELSTWEKIGNQAIISWQQSVENRLGKAAVLSLNSLRDAWSNAKFDLGTVKSRTGDTLKDGYTEDKSEIAEEKADKAAEDAARAAADAAKKQEEFMQWQKEQALKAEEERRREKEEAERKEKEAEEKADRIRAEQEAKQDAKEKEAEAKAAEAEAKADRIRAEQEAKQDAKEKEAEAKAAEAEAKADRIRA